jgi:hypothetical protein
MAVMVDPRLNSIHLDAPRRQQFRQARDQLLQARGPQTLAGERDRVAAPVGDTLVEPARKIPTGANFWLQDRDLIYPLKVGLNTLGRSPDNDIVVDDAYVSRRHCAILVHAGDVCELHDVASKNGTTVNGQRLNGPRQLVSGDEIRVCDRQFTFLGHTPPRPASDTAVQPPLA